MANFVIIFINAQMLLTYAQVAAEDVQAAARQKRIRARQL